MIAERIPDLQKLTVQEKLLLAGELWDQVANSEECLPPRQDHVRILEQRMGEFKKDPENLSHWEEVKRRILTSR